MGIEPSINKRFDITRSIKSVVERINVLNSEDVEFK